MIAKLKIPTLLTLFVLAGSAAGCELLSVDKRENVTPKVVSLAAAVDTFRVAYGETIEIQETGLRLRFEDVQESRCGADVTCIWAGDVRVTFLAERGGSEQRFAMKLPGLVSIPYDENVTATVLGHRLKLIQVDPYPITSAPQGKEAYRAVLSIEPGS
jgi:hypothetical protein